MIMTCSSIKVNINITKFYGFNKLVEIKIG